jgi:NAD(P)-dependent dehydrogenase (short-subunit alcohol dehydrogenase family)
MVQSVQSADLNFFNTKAMNSPTTEPLTSCPGKVLISGGTTGIGRATALLLSGLGAAIYIHGRNQQDLDATVRTIGKAGGTVGGMTADISRPEEIAEVFRAAEEFLGGLDTWIDCAAIGWSDAIDSNAEDWQSALSVNLGGVICGAKEAASRFKRQKRGNIVLIGSMSAEVRESRSSVYVATKAGIRGFAAALRKELNPDGVGVYLVEPGACDTDLSTCSDEERARLVREQLMLQPEDVASAIEFLLTRRQGCDVITLQIRPRMQLI